MKYAVISTSLHPQSKGRELSKFIFEYGKSLEMDIVYVDMQEYKEFPHCDAGASMAHPNVLELQEKLENIDGIILTVPIYNYTCSGLVKSMIEGLGARVWKHKVISLCAVVGSKLSFLSPVSFTHSFTVDFQSIVVPKFLLVSGEDRDENRFKEDVYTRAKSLVQTTKLFTESNQVYIALRHV